MAIKLTKKIKPAEEREDDAIDFVKAYDDWADQIYRFVYFKVGNKEEAQDLTSGIFLKTWNHLKATGEVEGKTLKSLIYKIARNSVIDYYRSNRARLDRLSASLDEAQDIEDENINIEKAVEISSEMIFIKEKLYELKDEYREIIILRFIDELSISEIADILDKSKGNIRILIYRAVKALRDITNQNNK